MNVLVINKLFRIGSAANDTGCYLRYTPCFQPASSCSVKSEE